MVPVVPAQDGTSVTCRGVVVFRVVDPAAVSRVADIRGDVVQLASRAWVDVVSASTELTSVLDDRNCLQSQAVSS